MQNWSPKIWFICISHLISNINKRIRKLSIMKIILGQVSSVLLTTMKNPQPFPMIHQTINSNFLKLMTREKASLQNLISIKMQKLMRKNKLFPKYQWTISFGFSFLKINNKNQEESGKINQFKWSNLSFQYQNHLIKLIKSKIHHF